MNNKANEKAIQLVYTGNKFKLFLRRNGISYKEASEALGIDKNTVGKAVRGGNLNIDIILRICNTYGLRITDFFKYIDKNGEVCTPDYYISPINSFHSGCLVSEDKFNYKKCENADDRMKYVCDMIENGHGALLDLIARYEECRRIIEELSNDKNKQE